MNVLNEILDAKQIAERVPIEAEQASKVAECHIERWFDRWMMIGPFEADSAAEQSLPLSEIDPIRQYGNGPDAQKWRDCQGPTVFAEAGSGGKEVWFAACYVYARQEIDGVFHYSTSAEPAWYLNGESIGNGRAGSCSVVIRLRHGWNLLLCRLEYAGEDSWEFSGGLSGRSGEEIYDIFQRTAFMIPGSPDTHMFGRNPDEDRTIQLGCREKEVNRTNPDTVVYVPKEGPNHNDGDNEHFLVIPAPKSKGLLAFWTQGKVEPSGDNHIVLARSSDGGKTWSEPEWVVGTHMGTREFQASWGFPVVADNGRLYCFYTKTPAGVLAGVSGVLGSMQSDDEGRTWRHGVDRLVPSSYRDPDDSSRETGGFIVWQKTVRDAKGRQISGYTEFNEFSDRPSVCHLIRFDNINEGPEVEDLQISFLPDDPQGVGLPECLEDSQCSEPAIVTLPDGRLFMVMRTLTGYIWYSISEDAGHSWREPEVLRYCDNGEKVKHPLASCPLFALEDGRYLLLFSNNNHYASRKLSDAEILPGMGEYTHRRPAYLTVGEFMPRAHQPIHFGPAKLFLDNGGVLVSAKASNEVATYPSLTECGGERILWYPDRKYYLLGKRITDDFLR